MVLPLMVKQASGGVAALADYVVAVIPDVMPDKAMNDEMSSFFMSDIDSPFVFLFYYQ